MHQEHDAAGTSYPHGRGYGHDYLRGGEVLGGYGYAAREEYSLPRGAIARNAADHEQDAGERERPRGVA